MILGTYTITQATKKGENMTFTLHLAPETASVDGPAEIEIERGALGPHRAYLIGAFERGERFDLILDNRDEAKPMPLCEKCGECAG